MTFCLRSALSKKKNNNNNKESGIRSQPIDLIRIHSCTLFSTIDLDQLAKTRRHHRKERLKIFFEKKVSKFESDLMKTIESKSHKILQWGPSLVPHYTNVCKISDSVAKPYFRGFGRHFINLIRHSFSQCRQVLTNWSVQKLKITASGSVDR